MAMCPLAKMRRSETAFWQDAKSELRVYRASCQNLMTLWVFLAKPQVDAVSIPR